MRKERKAEESLGEGQGEGLNPSREISPESQGGFGILGKLQDGFGEAWGSHEIDQDLEMDFVFGGARIQKLKADSETKLVRY